MSQHRPKPQESGAPAEEDTKAYYSRNVSKQITSKALKAAAIEGEIEIDEELSEIYQTLKDRLAQIRRKAFVARPEFPERLIAYGKAFVAQGERMARLPLMPEQGRPLRKFSSAEEWRRELTESEKP